MGLLERILGIYTVSIYHESKRFVEIKSLVFLIKIVQGVRRVTLLYYFSVVSLVLFTAGILMVVIQGVNQYQKGDGMYFDAIIILGMLLALLSGYFSLWLLSEKRWITAFNLHGYIQDAVSSSSNCLSQEAHGMSRDELRKLIDELVEERLKGQCL